MAKRHSVIVREFLSNAKSSALLAVETFNKPTVEFRVQVFIMLMHVAWTSLFLAVFHRGGIRPFHREKNGYHYVKIDGEPKAWDIAECVSQYWMSETNAVRKNLEFLIGFRNKIEHFLDQAALLKLTFGECQSLVTNFEDRLVHEFGGDHSLVDNLSLSIQLSTFRNTERGKVILQAVDRSTKSVVDFISDFRSSLDDDIYSDMRYSHKLFLLPRTTGHLSRDALAIEWVDLDNLTTQEAQDVNRLLAIIRPRHMEVRNRGNLTAGKVCERIRNELGIEPFGPSSQHVRCWKFFNVRPPTTTDDPYACKTEFCQYDEAFNGYVYTEAWVRKLLKEPRNPERFNEIMNFRRLATT